MARASATSATADGLEPEGASQTKKFCLQVIKKRPRKSFAYKLLKRGLANLMSPTSTSGVAPPLFTSSNIDFRAITIYHIFGLLLDSDPNPVFVHNHDPSLEFDQSLHRLHLRPAL
ncbi:hypothetical protein EVAR_102416_1 [Eumeta japonica]|uniref:Uncharacterized protein n=1 Tax=Eumeta variegata TaxID=151549 RepID=A0A4C1YW08_EUMVA|nr:hypothetical protein EVAR_102416_1 [Eumeta japonica]